MDLKTARANLSRDIREAKRQYSRRIAHCLSDSRDTVSLQTITEYKPPPWTCDSTIPLLNELTTFFPCFEAQNSTNAVKNQHIQIFLKDHATLTTGAMAAENSALHCFLLEFFLL